MDSSANGNFSCFYVAEDVFIRVVGVGSLGSNFISPKNKLCLTLSDMCCVTTTSFSEPLSTRALNCFSTKYLDSCRLLRSSIEFQFHQFHQFHGTKIQPDDYNDVTVPDACSRRLFKLVLPSFKIGTRSSLTVLGALYYHDIHSPLFTDISVDEAMTNAPMPARNQTISTFLFCR